MPPPTYQRAEISMFAPVGAGAGGRGTGGSAAPLVPAGPESGRPASGPRRPGASGRRTRAQGASRGSRGGRRCRPGRTASPTGRYSITIAGSAAGASASAFRRICGSRSRKRIGTARPRRSSSPERGVCTTHSSACRRPNARCWCCMTWKGSRCVRLPRSSCANERTVRSRLRDGRKKLLELLRADPLFDSEGRP